MRTTTVRLFVPLMILAAACAKDATTTARVSGDLQKDLEASAPSTLELANATAGYKPMRFVSDIEQTENATPVERTKAPRHVAARSAANSTNETNSPAPETSQQIQVAETPTVSNQAPAADNDVPRVPSVAPRPAPLPVDYGSANGSARGDYGSGRGDRGMGIGEAIGVIIRGGAVGDDHCVPNRGPGRRGRGFPINPAIVIGEVIRASGRH